MILKQKRLWDRRIFELKEDCIHVIFKTVDKEFEMSYKFDQIGSDKIKYKKKAFSIFTGVLFIVLLILGRWLLNDFEPKSNTELTVLFSILAFIFFIFGLIYYDNQKVEVAIIGGEKELVFLANSPSEVEVNDFLDAIINKRKDRIIRRGLSLSNKSLSNEYRMAYLNDLISEDYINDFEFEKYKSLFENNSKKIGF
jgi:hypothetical protein